jgi:signal transduction histidine kinase
MCLKNYSFLLLLFFVRTIGIAQPSLADSLKTELAKAQSDTAKVTLLSELASHSGVADMKVYTEQLFALTGAGLRSKPYKLLRFYLKYYAIALNNQAFILENEGGVEAALQKYKVSWRISETIHDTFDCSQVLTNIGYVYKDRGMYDTALSYYEKALLLKEKLNDKPGEAGLYSNIGVLYRTQGNIHKALECYQKGLRLREETLDTIGIANNLNNMGGIYITQNDNEQALKCHQRALLLCEQVLTKKEMRVQSTMIATLGNIGGIYLKENELPKALHYFRRALDSSESLGFKWGIALNLNSLGRVCEQQEKWDEALEYYKKCIALNEGTNSKERLANNWGNMGSVYQKKNELVKAIACFQKSLELSRELGLVEIVQKTSEKLYTLYKQKGNNAAALEMHELFTRMQDSLNNDKIRKEVIRSQYKYEYEKKAMADSLGLVQEKNLTREKLKQARTQRYLLVLGLVLLAVAGLFVFQQLRHRQKIRMAKLRTKIANDLHDEVGSSLSSISMYAGVARMHTGAEKNAAMVEKIEHTSRETMENMSDIVWSIQPRNDHFLHVLEKMKHFGESVIGSVNASFQFEYASGVEKTGLNMEQRKNTYLIYKEAINNAAKYAKAGKVEVCFEKQGKDLVMTVQDDGAGMSTDNFSVGNGLQSMKQRASELNGNLEIQTAPGQGTRIRLRFKTT